MDVFLLDYDIDRTMERRDRAVDELAVFYKNDSCRYSMDGHDLRAKIELLNLQICKMKMKRFSLFIRDYDISSAIFWAVIWAAFLAVLFTLAGCKIDSPGGFYY